MNKFQIVALILRVICIIYLLLISYWCIFQCDVHVVKAFLWWFINAGVIVTIGYISLIFWEKE